MRFCELQGPLLDPPSTVVYCQSRCTLSVLISVLSIDFILAHRFGYVEFSSMRKAKDALENVNGLELDGRDVRLDFAKGPRGGGGGGGGDDRRGPRGGGGGGRGELSASVWTACESTDYCCRDCVQASVSS